MSDDDKTPRGWVSKRRVQTSDDRALASQRRPAPARGVPVVGPPPEFDPDVTSPYDLVERKPGPEAQDVVQRSRRNSDDPATFGDVVNLAVELTKAKSQNRQREREAEVVLQGPHKAHRATRRNLIATVIAAAAAVGAAAKQWVDPPRPTPDAGEIIRVQQLEHTIDRIDVELREIRAVLGRRSELAPKEGR